jgi:hypothetical protein
VPPEGDFGPVEVIRHELVDQKHARDVPMLPIAGNSEVTVGLPHRTRDASTVRRFAQLDRLLTVERVGTVPNSPNRRCKCRPRR